MVTLPMYAAKLRLVRLLPAVGLALLAACSNSQDHDEEPTPSTPMSTVSGVAAVGAPIAGASVTLRCTNASNPGATSADDGSWSLSLPSSALPCAVRVSGGSVGGVANTLSFYSLAAAVAAGGDVTAQLTPLSDLALADAVNATLGLALADWYAGSSLAGQLPQIDAALDAAIAHLRDALQAAGYTLPEGFDPFLTALSAGTASDLYDALLDAYGAALTAAGQSYADALASFVGGAGLPQPATPPASDDVSGPLSAPGSSDIGHFFEVLAGDYQLQVAEVSPGAGNDFVLGGVHTVQMRGDGTVSIRGATQTLSYTYQPHTLSDYTQENAGSDGEKDIARFYAANGSAIDLYITYEPGIGYLTLTAQGFSGGEGGVLLVSRRGQPGTPSEPTEPTEPTEPNPPTTGGGSGVLGPALRSVFAGDYTLKCSTSPGQAVQSFAFAIAADGSSRFKGNALIDATHAGTISVGGSAASTMTLSFTPEGGGDYVVLGFKADGSFYPNSVRSEGQVLGCYYNSGHSAPPASAQAPASIATAVGALARSQTLNCTQASQTDARALVVGSDGGAQLGNQSFSAAQITAISDAILFGSQPRASFSYADVSGGAYRSLSVELDAQRATSGALLGTGFGPNDVSSCTP